MENCIKKLKLMIVCGTWKVMGLKGHLILHYRNLKANIGGIVLFREIQKLIHKK